MKKTISSLLAISTLLISQAFLVSCSGLFNSSNETDKSKPEANDSNEFKAFDIYEGITYDKETNTFICNGAELVSEDGAYFSLSLKKFGGKKVTLEFSADMEVENKGDSGAYLMWQISNPDFPVCQGLYFGENQTSTQHASFTNSYEIKENVKFYLSTWGTTPENLIIKVKNPVLKVTDYVPEPIPEDLKGLKDWMSVDSLKSKYVDSGYFDYFGFSAENNQLSQEAVQKGLSYHGNTITMGNEFKPCSVLGEYAGITPVVTDAKFTGSNGVEISVPDNVPDFNTVDNILSICKDNNLNMRGHVLVWHSQTPEYFFRENFDKSEKFVSKEEMDARQEWYIKTVLEHVTEWENKNNNGEHIIWAWDVVNEAVADDANDAEWLRTASNWYNVYKDESFIVNAFRYANKYAPKDVLLTYNDYNCYIENKNNAICNLIKEIQSHSEDAVLPTRIDVAGMQAHVLDDFPAPSAFDKAVKNFINLGVDVHVTEFDIANRTKEYSKELNGRLWKEFFNYMIENRKANNKNGITCITIWGIEDESSWLIAQYATQTKNKQRPLLFTVAENYYGVKPEFYEIFNLIK